MHSYIASYFLLALIYIRLAIPIDNSTGVHISIMFYTVNSKKIPRKKFSRIWWLILLYEIVIVSQVWSNGR